MNIKRFFAPNSREALNMVRRELGEDAVILSNKQMNGGNEILAFREEDMEAIMAEDTTVQNTPMYEDDNEPTPFLSHIHKKNRENIVAFDVRQPEDSLSATTVTHALSSAYPSSTEQSGNDIASMMQEIRSLRSFIEPQLAELSWSNIQKREPMKTVVLSKLIGAGFSPGLSRQLAEKLPVNQSAAEAINWANSILVNNLHTIESEREILDEGGIFALIGPTGVGKTTTTAKLAARCVMKHGASKLGLITTDAYRIGGHEQLRIYGKILGVMVHAVKDEADLRIALEELKNKHTILIDTVGVSQRDRMVTEQIAMLSSTNTSIKKLLCLNATNTGQTLTDVINAYKGKGLDGCVMTKLDEAATIGGTLDVIIREKLKLFYVANGQRVPEDLHLANKQFLLHRAFKLGETNGGPFQFRDEELPFLMANSPQSAAQGLSMEVNHV